MTPVASDRLEIRLAKGGTFTKKDADKMLKRLYARGWLSQAREPDVEPVVLNTTMEHHSNELPWRYARRARRRVSLVRMPVDADGFLDLRGEGVLEDREIRIEGGIGPFAALLEGRNFRHELEVEIEPGRLIAGNAGILVSGVIYLEDMFAQHLVHKTALSLLAVQLKTCGPASSSSATGRAGCRTS